MLPHRSHWLTQFALGSLKNLTNGLLATAHLTDVIRIGDIGVEGGRFTLSTIKASITALQEISQKSIEVYKLDTVANNANYMTRLLATDPDSYSTLQNIHTYFTSGTLSGHLFAQSSLNLVFISHLLSGVTVRDSAPDTIVTSLSNNREFMEQREKQASEDFVLVMSKRHGELIKEGMACIDVIGRPTEASTLFGVLDDAVKTAYQRGIVPEGSRKVRLRAHFRTEEEVKNDIELLKDRFQLISYEYIEVPMPQYTEFLETQNIEQYAEGLCTFWNKALAFELLSQLSLTEGERVLSSVLEVFKEKIRETPPVAITGSHHMLFRRL